MVLSAAITWFPTSAISIALPTLRDEFDASLTELAWIPTVYMLVFAAMLPLVGRLSDRLGCRRFLVGGAAAFGVAALLAAAAPGYPLLLGAVILLGLGGVCINVTSLAILDVAYEGKARAKAIGIWAAATGLGQAIGIPVGGVLLESPLGWPAIFWICAPVAGVVLLVGVRYVGESAQPTSARVDLAGAFVLGSALVLVAAVGVQGPAWGWASPRTLALVAGVAVLALAMPPVFRRAQDPIVPMAAMRQPQYLGGLSMIVVMNLPLSGALFLLPLYLQSGLGESAVVAGVVLLGLGGSTFVAAALGGWVSRPLGPRLTAAGASLLSALGALLVAQLDADTGAVELLPGLIVLGAGIGLIASVATSTAMSAVPPTIAGSASAMTGATGFLGGALGVAVATGLFDGFGGDNASSSLAANDPRAIADGVSGTFWVLAAVMVAAAFIPLATFRLRATSESP